MASYDCRKIRTLAFVTQPDLSRLQVRRRKGGWRDLLREYRIEVDGHPAATLRRGQTLSLNVSPGEHTVRARIDWTGSPELSSTFDAGETVALVVGVNGGPLKGPWQMFGKESWLKIERDQD